MNASQSPAPTVYLLKQDLDQIPPHETFRRGGRDVIDALPMAWRAPVVLKPNIVWKTDPDSGIVTHPAFVAGLVEGLLAKGLAPSEIVVAEGGGIEETHDMIEYYEVNGYTAALRGSGVELRDLNEDDHVVLTDSRRQVIRRFYVARTILEALQRGTLVNVAKMKTHNMATVTLCVKNMQGMLTPIRHRHLCTLYPRSVSDDGHGLDYRLVDKLVRFYQKLADLAMAIRPHLNIVEGIVGRDGTGFNRGKNIPMGIVLAGRDALATDHVGAMLMGFAAEDVGCLRVAADRGMYDMEATPPVGIWRDGEWKPCPDWLIYQADPAFELLRREDLTYHDEEEE